MRRIFSFKMSTLEKILHNNNTAIEKLKALKIELEATKRELIQQKKQQYIRENAVLSEQVEKLKTELISLEKRNGKQQIPIPGDAVAEVVEKSSIIAPTTPISLSSEAQSKPTQAKEKKPKKEKSKAAPETTSDGGSGKKTKMSMLAYWI